MMKVRLFSKGVKKSWMLSYCLILCISILGMGLLWGIGNHIIYDRIVRLTQMTLSDLQTSFDTFFSELRDTTLGNAFSQSLDSVLYEDSLENEDHYVLYSLQTEMKKNSLSNLNCRELLLFLRRSGYVVTSSTIYDPSIAQRMVEQHAMIPVQEWDVLLNSPVRQGFLPFTQTDGKKNIAFRISLPFSADMQEAVLIAVPERGKVEGLLKRYHFSEQGILLLVHDNGQIVFSQGQQDLFEENQAVLQQQADSHEMVRVNGRRFVMTAVHSNIIPCRYVLLEPYEEVFGPLQRFVWLSGAALALVILLGGLASYHFIMRNYSPLRELIGQISENLNVPVHENEYQTLEQAMKTATHTRHAYQEMELIRLLRYKQPIPIPETESGLMEINFFAVFLIRPEKLEENDENFELMCQTLCGMLEKILNEKKKYRVAEIDGMIAVVQFSEEEPSLEQMEQTAKRLQMALGKEEGMVFSISYSAVHGKGDFLAQCYSEAYQAMDYRVFVGIGKILSYQENSQSEGNYYFPLEWEQKLIYTIQTGDQEEAEKILEAIYRENFENERPTPDMVRCLMFDLLATMIKALETVQSEFFSKLNPVEELFRCETLPQMQKKISMLLSQICDYISKRKKNSSQLLSEAAVQYMKENFSDPGLNMAAIAEHFGCSGPYLTKVLKKQFGKTPLEYITSLRVEQGKQLLENTEYNVESIAAMTGYLSANTFIRIFKRYVGVTPGNYRELLHKNQKE